MARLGEATRRAARSSVGDPSRALAGIAAWLQTASPRLRWVVYGALAIASVFFTRYWAQGEFIG